MTVNVTLAPPKTLADFFFGSLCMKRPDYFTAGQVTLFRSYASLFLFSAILLMERPYDFIFAVVEIITARIFINIYTPNKYEL